MSMNIEIRLEEKDFDILQRIFFVVVPRGRRLSGVNYGYKQQITGSAEGGRGESIRHVLEEG